jgi:hypothetical protein
MMAQKWGKKNEESTGNMNTKKMEIKLPVVYRKTANEYSNKGKTAQNTKEKKSRFSINVGISVPLRR